MQNKNKNRDLKIMSYNDYVIIFLFIKKGKVRCITAHYEFNLILRQNIIII